MPETILSASISPVHTISLKAVWNTVDPGLDFSPDRAFCMSGCSWSRRDRAAVGLLSLLELYRAAERVRVDGEEKDDIGDGVREGLM
ncbi:hypothetical protein [Stenotrophomonas sp.]|uniref:hypothetical protein n=1 Tax=Stenotrophomonas sp. TaxID=69392 RepID=UPI0025E96D35|nr:hypothetical protein [Stenotrophomonas sp.]